MSSSRLTPDSSRLYGVPQSVPSSAKRNTVKVRATLTACDSRPIRKERMKTATKENRRPLLFLTHCLPVNQLSFVLREFGVPSFPCAKRRFPFSNVPKLTLQY